MFATQQTMDVTADSPRKRGRDDDQSMGPLSPSFGEHRHKRLQCLPLRTSPQKPLQTSPNAGDCDDAMMDDQAPKSHFSPWSSSPAQFDAEMDVMETLNSAPPSRLEAIRLDSELSSVSGRMPTPIQPNFSPQYRNQQSNWGQDATQSPHGVMNMGHQHNGFEDGSDVPRTMANEPSWHSVQQNRRLPSPISEGDDFPSQSKDFADVTLDSADQQRHHHGMDHPNAMMDIENRASTPPLDANGEPTTPSPKRGHVRNMHTLNNWTWQPGMKKSFSIGYRSDCEKCRLKVPGHFNHIVIS